LRQAESEAVKWKARQRSTEQKLGYEEKLRGQAEADLMFRTEQRDDLLKRLEQAEAEARKWKSTAQGLAEELSNRSVEWFIENGGDEADGWSPAQVLARYQPGGES
jgi:hypothetical protein